jgi:hypothetical protein
VRATVALTSEEIRRLRRLRGQSVDSLWTDGWSVHLRSGPRTIAFAPEEVVVDDLFHPDADVVRLRIDEHPHVDPEAPPLAELCGSLGRILGLARMTTAVASEPPVYSHPEDPALDAAYAGQVEPGRVVALVDVGIALETEGGWTVIATDGLVFAVCVALPGRNDERLACLAGRVQLVPVFAEATTTATSEAGVPA